MPRRAWWVLAWAGVAKHCSSNLPRLWVWLSTGPGNSRGYGCPQLSSCTCLQPPAGSLTWVMFLIASACLLAKGYFPACLRLSAGCDRVASLGEHGRDAVHTALCRPGQAYQKPGGELASVYTACLVCLTLVGSTECRLTHPAVRAPTSMDLHCALLDCA